MTITTVELTISEQFEERIYFAPFTCVCQNYNERIFLAVNTLSN